MDSMSTAPGISYLPPTGGRPHDMCNSSLNKSGGNRPVCCTITSVKGFVACQGRIKGVNQQVALRTFYPHMTVRNVHRAM